MDTKRKEDLMSRKKSVYPSVSFNDQRKLVMKESVSGSSEVLVNGKVPRANKKNNLRDTTEMRKVVLKKSYSSHPSNIGCAITLERYRELEAIRAERRAKRLARK